jgi:hypothetical protein
LNDLFHYYRVNKQDFEILEQMGLKLEKMDYVMPTDEELKEKARTLLAAKDEREILALKRELSANVCEPNEKIALTNVSYAKLSTQAEEIYNESVNKLRDQAVKNGLINTSAYLDKLTKLESEKSAKILSLAVEKENTLAAYNATLAALNKKLSDCENYYLSVHEKQVLAKVEELRDEEEKIEREVFEYNNGVEERVQRYENTIKRSNASLYIAYLDVKYAEITRDQLVEMGYYDDVTKCVCGYYDTLPALTAYQDFCSERKLPIYLDDYYQNVAYMYGLRAGAFS